MRKVFNAGLVLSFIGLAAVAPILLGVEAGSSTPTPRYSHPTEDPQTWRIPEWLYGVPGIALLIAGWAIHYWFEKSKKKAILDAFDVRAPRRKGVNTGNPGGGSVELLVLMKRDLKDAMRAHETSCGKPVKKQLTVVEERLSEGSEKMGELAGKLDVLIELVKDGGRFHKRSTDDGA